MNETKEKLVELLRIQPGDIAQLDDEKIFSILSKSIYVQDSVQIAFMARLGIDPDDADTVAEVSAAFPVFAIASGIMVNCVNVLLENHPEFADNTNKLLPISGELPKQAGNEKAYDAYNIGLTDITFSELFEAVTESKEKDSLT